MYPKPSWPPHKMPARRCQPFVCSVCQSGVLDFDHADARSAVGRFSRLLQLRTIFTALSKPGAEACGDDAAAALQRHKDRFSRLLKQLLPALLTFDAGRAREKATSWQKDVSDAHDKWTVELTRRCVSTVLSCWHRCVMLLQGQYSIRSKF